MTNEIDLMDLRKRVIDGETPSAEEYAMLVESLRRDRTAGKTAKKAAKAAKDPSQLFGSDLSGLLDTNVDEK